MLFSVHFTANRTAINARAKTEEPGKTVGLTHMTRDPT